MTSRGYSLKFVGVQYALVNGEGRYSYYVRASDNKEVNIFLNPAIYGGVSTEIVPVWDGTNLSFVPVSPSELDDRYTVGKQLRLVFGGSNASPVFDSSANLSQFELVKVYQDARVVPFVLFRVGDYRLASFSLFGVPYHEFFADLRNEIDSSGGTLTDSLFLDYLNNPVKVFQKFITVANTCAGPNAPILRFVDNDIYLDVDFSRYITHDNHSLQNDEHLFGMSNALNRGSFFYSVLSKVFCEKYQPVPYYDTLVKPMNGNYTIIGRPERLLDFNMVVSNAVNQAATYINDNTVKASFKDLANKILSEGLKDWFRPSSYRVVVGYSSPGNPIYQTVNVFLAYHGGSSNRGTVMLDVNGVAIGVPVSLGDTFDYTSGENQKAHPNSKSYVTGPYGAIPIYDSNGNIVGWYSDAYSK